MHKFGILILGGSWKISSELSCPAQVECSLKFMSHLEILLRDGCACGMCMKFGLRNVGRALNGHIAWCRLRLHVGDHLQSV